MVETGSKPLMKKSIKLGGKKIKLTKTEQIILNTFGKEMVKLLSIGSLGRLKPLHKELQKFERIIIKLNDIK